MDEVTAPKPANSPTLSLRLRILAVALLPLLLAVGLFAAYFAHRGVSEAEQTLERTGQDMARHLAEAVAYDLTAGNLPYVKRLLDFERDARRAEVIAISEGTDWRLFSGHANRLPTLYVTQLPPQWRQGPILYFAQPVRAPAGPATDPYLDPGAEWRRQPNYLVIALNREPVELTRSQIGLAASGMGTIAILLALVLAWRLSGRISQPLHDITGTVHRLAGGSLSERVAESSPGDIGQLEQGINRMARALEAHQGILERRIREATAELMGQKQAAEAAVLAKSRFLAAASHDLRQPLHALTLLTNALLERVPAGELKQLAGHIEASASAMESLLNSLLDLSKLDAGVVEAHPECFPLARVLDHIARQFGPLAEARGLRLTVRPTRMWSYSDPVLVERILSNLVSNALRYTERGSVLVGARRVQADWLRLEVRDTGKGIPAEYQTRIFEEYFQLENPERHRDKGLGLGLAIVSRLARLLGSGVAVSSEPGRGACFQFRLARCPAPKAPPPAQAPAAGGLSLPLERALVAFIDDDETILEAMVALFDSWGVALAAGEDANEVRDELLALGRAPDIILSDYRLRDGRSGIGAILALREAFGLRIPAVLLTGDTATETIQTIDACGLPVLHKPLKPAKLRAFLNHLLASAQ